jgi:drug/metabolite transporter (DMT)-like permease
VAAAILWGIIALFQPRLLRIDRHGLLSCMALGLANSISLSSFYMALGYIDASLATVIFASHPIVVLIILRWRGELLNKRKIARVMLAIFGIVLLIGISGHVQWQGVVFALGTAIFYGIFLVLLQELVHDYPTPQVTLYVITTMAILVGAMFLVFYPLNFEFSSTGWTVIFVTGAISTVVARYAIFTGVQRIGSSQTALLGPVETLMIVTWAVLFLHESLNGWQILGGGFVILSALLAAPRKQKPSA